MYLAMFSRSSSWPKALKANHKIYLTVIVLIGKIFDELQVAITQIKKAYTTVKSTRQIYTKLQANMYKK